MSFSVGIRLSVSSSQYLMSISVIETICIRADQTIKKGNRKTSIAFFNFLWRNIRISPLKKQSVSYVRDDDELPIRGGRLL